MRLRSLRFRLTVWYAGLLAAGLALSALAVYVGLARYLESSLRRSLSDEAHVIGQNFVSHLPAHDEAWLINEVNDEAPEINGRFIRILRPDGTVLYRSGAPKDGSFNPTAIPRYLPLVAGKVESLNIATPQSVILQRLAFEAGPGAIYQVEVGAAYQSIAQVLHGLVLIFAVGVPVVVAAAIMGGYVITRQALAPVNAITQQAERITSHNFAQRLPVPDTGDELESLSRSLNRMIARLEVSFEHINRFSADASHELRTPLTILRGELEALVRTQLSPDLLDAVGSTLEEVERMARIVDHLLIISRLDAGEVLPSAHFDVGAMVASTVEQITLLAEEKSITLDQNIISGVEVDGDPLRLRQAVVNLLDNAVKYTPRGGAVQVTVARDDVTAIVSVADNGIGVPQEALPHIFERFYRADKDRSRDSGGAGLGLAIVKAVCNAHAGDVSVTSTPGVGSCFTIRLRLAKQQAAAIDKEPESENGKLIYSKARSKVSSHETIRDASLSAERRGHG